MLIQPFCYLFIYPSCFYSCHLIWEFINLYLVFCGRYCSDHIKNIAKMFSSSQCLEDKKCKVFYTVLCQHFASAIMVCLLINNLPYLYKLYAFPFLLLFCHLLLFNSYLKRSHYFCLSKFHLFRNVSNMNASVKPLFS